MLMYPPGKLYQRSEDRAQSNIDDSATNAPHACNDLGYAAAILINRGYNIFLRDYQTERATLSEVKKNIESFHPDMILISTTNATIHIDIDFVNWIKTFCDCKIILKGAIFFNMAENLFSTLDLHNIDYLIGGEIDTIIGELTDTIFKNVGQIQEIPGIIYKDENRFIKTAFNRWETNLDKIPFPARELMRNDIYVRPDTGEPMATIQVARGCPAQCTYCLTPIISGKAIRKRSIENIFAEIEDCYYNFGIKNFFFKADTFTIDSEWAEALCDKIIESDLHGKIEFTVNSRAKPLNIKLLEKLKTAGCFMFAIGFESGSENTLKMIKKGVTKEENLIAAKMVQQVGIPLLGFFMIGFPWETKEDILDTLNFIFEINPDFMELHIAMPYFGTELYSDCLRFKTISGEAWGNDYCSPNTIGTASVTMDEILKLKKIYLLKFYLRPSFIIKKFKACFFNPIIIKNYAKYGFKLIKKNLFR